MGKGRGRISHIGGKKFPNTFKILYNLKQLEFFCEEKKNPVLLSKGVADQVDTNKCLLQPFYRPNLFLSSFEIFGDPIMMLPCSPCYLGTCQTSSSCQYANRFLRVRTVEMRDFSYRSSIELSLQEETPRNLMAGPSGDVVREL